MVSPIYACVLMTVGTLAGRHAYFAASGQKILGRFLPRKVSRELACAPAKAKKARQAAGAAASAPAPATPPAHRK